MCRVFKNRGQVFRLPWHPQEGKPGSLCSPFSLSYLTFCKVLIGSRAALGSTNKADNASFILLNMKTVNWTQSLEIAHSVVLANPAEMQ